MSFTHITSDFKVVLTSQQNIPHHSKGDSVSLLLQQTRKMTQLDKVEHYPRAKSNFGLFLYSLWLTVVFTKTNKKKHNKENIQESLYKVHKAWNIYSPSLYRKSVLIPPLQHSLPAAYRPPWNPFLNHISVMLFVLKEFNKCELNPSHH